MYLNFVKETVGSFDDNVFSEFKEIAVGEYIIFKQVKKEDITKDVMIEKITDYFESKDSVFIKLENMIHKYNDCLDDIVSPYIPKEQKPKKGEKVIVARSRQYYDAVARFKKSKDVALEELLDYTRIMLCLYMAVINNDYKPIDNFNFAFESLDIEKILSEIKSNKNSYKKFYDLSDNPEYQMIILLMMFFSLKNNGMEGV